MERDDDAEELRNVHLPWLRFDPGSLYMTPGGGRPCSPRPRC